MPQTAQLPWPVRSVKITLLRICLGTFEAGNLLSFPPENVADLTTAFRSSLLHVQSESQLRPPLWSNGQSSWPQIQRSRVRFRADLERGPLSLVKITEELLECFSFRVKKIEINGRGDPLLWPRDTLYPQKLALTSPICSGRSVGIVCLRTKATECSLV
jgi:hypothetical protein